jgi:hypothetical protein
MITEARKRRWDVGIGVASSLITVIGILVGVWQFNRGEENKARLESDLLKARDTLEYKRKLWLERLATYQSVADVAGKIAACSPKDKKLGNLIDTFMAQYWGAMILVEDKDVENAMILFHDEIIDYRAGRSTPDRIKIRANDLGKALRRSSEHDLSGGSA